MADLITGRPVSDRRVWIAGEPGRGEHAAGRGRPARDQLRGAGRGRSAPVDPVPLGGHRETVRRSSVHRLEPQPRLVGVPYDDRVATRLRRVAGALAVAGPIVFSAAWIVAWAVQETYSPRREDISALAALDAQQPWSSASWRWLWAWSLGTGLLRAVAGGRVARVGAVLVLIAGLGILVAGVARNDCSSSSRRARPGSKPGTSRGSMGCMTP